ncbi:LysR family transcriptional regulator [Paraburkholderia hospita]|uniref:LysR family transcriptional regulator n=1 Tax=Paraburkholderia hospita TaxID=169430 RepID=UPI000DEFAF91|nr:LysR family transcriptional regulator [Paraburkholderia hospita]AXF05853.1 LysR family transcriptional regulator [Paraburkholderia hospita]
MDTLLSLRVFCTVAEHKSFTAAASRLGLSPAMASKHLHHLESRVGARLLNRTSRNVSLTEAGRLYFSQIRPMLEGLDEVEAAVSNVTVTPRGTLKLSAPVWAANTLVARVLAEYHHRYPDVSLDVDLSGRIVNLVDEGFDLALRAMTSARLDPGLVARPLIDVPFHFVASPSYLERAGRPAALSDLNGHSLLMYSGINFSGSLFLKGRDGEEAVKFRSVMRSENETMLHLAALEGMGLVFLPAWMTQSDIAKGTLEHVLVDEIQFGTTLHAVYPSRKYLSAKVRTFIDFLSSRLNDFHGN